jgi:hypothetical protein
MGKETMPEENCKEESTKDLEQTCTLFFIRSSIFNIDIVFMQVKILSKLRHVGKYNEYYFQALELLEACADLLEREMYE